MILDLNETRAPRRPRYDVCVIGSGPAGMTVAAELAATSLSVCVLESGQQKPTDLGDRLREVRSEGIPIKDYSRERVLGGASTTWAGLSSPLDPIDFTERPYLRQSGWPIDFETLAPYYAAAARRYRFPRLAMFDGGLSEVQAGDDLRLTWRAIDEKIFLARSEPQNFGREQRAIFERDDVDAYLDATVLRLEAASGERRVATAVARTRDGHEVEIQASAFVVATGGIENARLLLKSTDLCPAGLGNERDQVGRYLMNHPKNYFGVIELARPVTELSYYFGSLYRGFAGYAGLRLREDVQRDRGLLNSYVRLEPLYPWSDNPGVEALVLVVKRSQGLFGRWKKSREHKVTSLRDYSETGDDSELQNQRRSALGYVALLGTVLRHLPAVTRYVFYRVVESARPKVRRVRLRNFIEMEPDPDHRVTLSDEQDAYGERLALVRHECSELDRRSLIALHEVLRDELAQNGFGRLDGDLASAEPWPIDQDASHHLGATRMGLDPNTSVVDVDCRVHGVDNVYLAGGSVFPTSGCANPTFTIVALAIRLAEHLCRRLDVAPAHRVAATPRATAARGEEAAMSPNRRAVILGAGRRVLDTALPAFASVAGEISVERIYARSERDLSVGARDYVTTSVDLLEEEALAGADLLYVAVSKASVPEVLGRLVGSGLALGDVDLLIDTPPLSFKQLRHLDLLRPFRRVWVAEDCVELPYLPLLREVIDSGAIGALKEAVLLQSGYRYHAFATLKTLFGSAVKRARRRYVGKHAWCDLWFENGATARMLEPRDYAAGRSLYLGTKGSISDYPLATHDNLTLEPLSDEQGWRGFRIGDATAELSDAERALLVEHDLGDSVIARTEDMKRVGFHRLLKRVVAGEPGYPLEEGLDDMVIDYLLDRAGRYRAWLPISMRSGLGRAIWKSATRVLPG